MLHTIGHPLGVGAVGAGEPRGAGERDVLLPALPCDRALSCGRALPCERALKPLLLHMPLACERALHVPSEKSGGTGGERPRAERSRGVQPRGVSRGVSALCTSAMAPAMSSANRSAGSRISTLFRSALPTPARIAALRPSRAG